MVYQYYPKITMAIDDRTFFDNWTLFEARSYRDGRKKSPAPCSDWNDIRIDAALEPDLTLRATTRGTYTADRSGDQPVAFEITRRMIFAP